MILHRGDALAPHCDPWVLHASGACDACDLFPELQHARQLLGMNFTGQGDASKIPCPAEQRRELARIQRWPGNRPFKETPP